MLDFDIHKRRNYANIPNMFHVWQLMYFTLTATTLQAVYPEGNGETTQMQSRGDGKRQRIEKRSICSKVLQKSFHSNECERCRLCLCRLCLKYYLCYQDYI